MSEQGKVQREGDDCDSDVTKNMFRLAAFGCPTQRWTLQVHIWCVFMICMFYWSAYLCLHRGNCVLRGQYLKAAGSPRASALHPWPRSTEALSSVGRLTWNWGEDSCFYSSVFALFLISVAPFIINLTLANYCPWNKPSESKVYNSTFVPVHYCSDYFLDESCGPKEMS